MNILFKNIENIFKIKIKSSDDNSMDHLIYFNLLTIEYIKLMKSLKIILINFDKTQNELFKIIDSECLILRIKLPILHLFIGFLPGIDNVHHIGEG